MTPACAGLLERRRSPLGLLKSAFDAENFTPDYLGLFPAILVQFTLKMCVAGRNRGKFTKKPFCEAQGHLRSSMLTNPKSPSSVVVMICSMSVPNCIRFYNRRAIGSKITSFREVPLFDALVLGEPPHPGARRFVTKKLESTVKIS